MKHKTMSWGRGAFALGVLLIALLVLPTWKIWQQRQAEQAWLTQYANSERPLVAQQTQLKNALLSKQRIGVAQVHGAGALTLLCTDLDAQVYTQLYPQLQSRGFTATLALSPQALPGSRGAITTQQFLELVQAGWSTCLLWDGQTPLQEWAEPVQRWLARYSLELPQTVCLAQGQPLEGQERTLRVQGIAAVLHDGSDGRDLIAQTTNEAPWPVGVCGWNSSSVSNLVGSLTTNGGALALSISFTSQDPAQQYDLDLMGRMLDRLTTWQNQGGLLIAGVTDAYAQRLQAEADQAEAQRQYEAELAALQADLDALQAELDALRQGYRQQLGTLYQSTDAAQWPWMADLLQARRLTPGRADAAQGAAA